MSIEIANESGAAVDEAGLAAVARHVLDGMRVHPLAELSILLVEPAAMEQLNLQWMDSAGPTDVLAFPMDELRPPTRPGARRPGNARRDRPGAGAARRRGAVPAGCRRAGQQGGSPRQDELELLCTHGMHLLGYDHADPASTPRCSACRQAARGVAG